MDNLQINGGDSIGDFLCRSDLTTNDGAECYELIGKLHPNQPIVPVPCQGYCSLSFLVGSDKVLQFRPKSHRLDLQIADAARAVHGDFAPKTELIIILPSSGLSVYRMERIKGTSFKDFIKSNRSDIATKTHRLKLCEDFAAILAQSWQRRSHASLPKGKIGSSMVTRLEMLCTRLPFRFQKVAQKILQNIHCIQALPWVLTHGDVLSSNIMVDSHTGALTGLVDWAEAEMLPFGMCLYGLEEILGEMTPGGFRYHEDSGELREIFWSKLCQQIPDLQKSQELEAVQLSRDLGILLWHGIAFDNGAINRVVEPGRDIDEIFRLEAFFPPDDHLTWDRNSKI